MSTTGVRGAPSRALAAVAWLVAVSLIVVCLLRATHADQRSAEVAVVSVTPWLLLVAWPLAIGARLGRRRLLLAVSVLLVVLDVVWEAPALWPVGHAPEPVAGAISWRLFDANVAQNNVDLRGIGREIAVDHPDVVTLEELTPEGYRSLLGTGVLAPYRWKMVAVRPGAAGMAMWSRLPLDGLDAWVSGGGQVELQASVHVPGGATVRLDVVHVYAPVGSGEPAAWRRQLAEVHDRLRSEARPLVVAGDFNATADMGPFDHLLDLGLADSAVLAGRGWRMTWPRDQAWVIPYLRIDHVLLSSQLTVTAYRLGVGEGSDHRPLIVSLARRS